MTGVRFNPIEMVKAFELMMKSWITCSLRGLMGLALVAIVGCSSGPELVVNPSLHAKGETFGYRQWISPAVDQDVVLIGIHGFCGASSDYTNIGEYFLKHQPETALYAYELRGQGSDPIVARRGDIGNPEEWYRDLLVFTQMVRERHPEAKIIWFGESMGALIAAHAWCKAPKHALPCDGLILSSPIVRFRDDIPAWTPGLVQVAASTLPLARISQEALMGGQEVQMTQDSVHGDQVKKNSYNVDAYTLRLIGTLSSLIRGMNGCAEDIRGPVLVLHGGKDYFNTDADVRGFMARLPDKKRSTYRNYPKAYHLLMHDAQKERVFRDVEGWLNRLRKDRL